MKAMKAMKEVGFTCLFVLGAMLFSNLLWWPWVRIFAAGSTERAAVELWLWLGGLVAFGAMAAYMAWPDFEADSTSPNRTTEQD